MIPLLADLHLLKIYLSLMLLDIFLSSTSTLIYPVLALTQQKIPSNFCVHLLRMHLVAAHSHTLHSAPFFLWLPVLCLLNRSILRFRGHYLPNNATSPNQLGITGFSPNPASNTEPLFILPLY